MSIIRFTAYGTMLYDLTYSYLYQLLDCY